MFSPWTAPFDGSGAWWSHACMVRVTTLDIKDSLSLCNPTAMLKDSMMSVKMLYMIMNY